MRKRHKNTFKKKKSLIALYTENVLVTSYPVYVL